MDYLVEIEFPAEPVRFSNAVADVVEGALKVWESHTGIALAIFAPGTWTKVIAAPKATPPAESLGITDLDQLQKQDRQNLGMPEAINDEEGRQLAVDNLGQQMRVVARLCGPVVLREYICEYYRHCGNLAIELMAEDLNRLIQEKH